MRKYCTYVYGDINNKKKKVLFEYTSVKRYKNCGTVWITFLNCRIIKITGHKIFSENYILDDSKRGFPLPFNYYKERKFKAINDEAAELIFEVGNE